MKFYRHHCIDGNGIKMYANFLLKEKQLRLELTQHYIY